MDEKDNDREYVNIWEAPRDNALFTAKEIDEMISENPDNLPIPTNTDIFKLLSEKYKGGFKRGELCSFLSTPTSEHKSDIIGSMYRRKLSKSWELKDYIEKGEGTAQQMSEAQNDLDVLKKQLKGFEEYSQRDISQRDIGGHPLYVSPPLEDMVIGMRAFRDDSGKLNVDSYNLIFSPEFHRRNMGKPTLALAGMIMAIDANRAVTAITHHTGHYEYPLPIVEKEESQLAKERKHVPYQHPKKRAVKLNPLLKGLIKRTEE